MGIQPTQQTPSSSPSSTPSSTPRSTPPPCHGQASSGDDSGKNHYDTMIVGLTGQGKTTTSDKMVIAMELGMEDRKLTAKELSLWDTRTTKDLKKGYFKGHEASQVLEDPQKYLDDFRRELNLNGITKSCQLVSNDVTKMRILDVPGFFSDDEVQDSLVQPSSLLENDIHKFTCNHLAIMRDILRVQSTMRMKFRRILYFLPVKGPLVRSSMILRQELILLARYFGRSIFDSMVLVATVQTRFSKMKALQGELFTEEESTATQLAFQNTLEGILASYPVADGDDGSTPCPPVVFISLLNTGEEIVDMVRRAQVRKDCLELKFEPGICIKCPCTINWLENEKVEVIPTGNGEGPVIPYSDSVCHPIFLPRGRRPHRVVQEKDGARWVELSVDKGWKREEGAGEEVCHKCQEPPGTEGCLKVGEKYIVKMEKGDDEEIIVDHTNHIEKHRTLVQKKHKLEVLESSEEEGQVPEGQEELVPEGRHQEEGQIPEMEVEVHENQEERQIGNSGGEERPASQVGGAEGGVSGAQGGASVFEAEDDGHISDFVLPGNRTPHGRFSPDVSLLPRSELGEGKG